MRENSYFFWFTKTSVTVKTYELSFCAPFQFLSAIYSEISLSLRCFPYLFTFLYLFISFATNIYCWYGLKSPLEEKYETNETIDVVIRSLVKMWQEVSKICFIFEENVRKWKLVRQGIGTRPPAKRCYPYNKVWCFINNNFQIFTKDDMIKIFFQKILSQIEFIINLFLKSVSFPAL